jgi:hypothetical protein
MSETLLYVAFGAAGIVVGMVIVAFIIWYLS